MEFTSISQIDNYLKSNSSVGGINPNTIRQTLTKEAQRLKGYIIEEIDNYYNSYKPTGIYQRTYKMRNSLVVETPTPSSNEQWSISIGFGSGSMHPSLFNGGSEGFAFGLRNYGYITRLDEKLNAYGFTRYEGYDFLGKAIQKYNENNPYNIKIDVLDGGGGKITGKYSYGRNS
ncbi:hypothetical protein AB1283_00550 [Bacillus sp. S13(2024)]|uniref:hypothetical protein n=1 Tax=Bacillus sp. S13(2024) TaxID=3162885 RepID=UPI003D232ABA